MNDAEPWKDPQFAQEAGPRYSNNTDNEMQELEKAKSNYTEARKAIDKDLERAKRLFEEAAKGFDKCGAPGLARKARAEKNKLN